MILHRTRSCAVVLLVSAVAAFCAIQGANAAATGTSSPTTATTPEPPPSAILTVRLVLPVTGLQLYEQWGTWALFGAGASLRSSSSRGQQVEFSAVYMGNPCEQGPQMTLRAGASPRIWPRRLPPGRREARLPLLFGVSHYRAGGGGCDGDPYYELTSLTFATGIEGGPGGAESGFNIRALVYMGGGL